MWMPFNLLEAGSAFQSLQPSLEFWNRQISSEQRSLRELHPKFFPSEGSSGSSEELRATF